MAIAYSIGSEELPNEDQLVALGIGVRYAEPTLPGQACCQAAKGVLYTACHCDASLSDLMVTLGHTSTSTGLEGAVQICADLCGYEHIFRWARISALRFPPTIGRKGTAVPVKTRV